MPDFNGVELARVRAITTEPDFIDMYGYPADTPGNAPGDIYNPTEFGERGFMLLPEARMAQAAGHVWVLVDQDAYFLSQFFKQQFPLILNVQTNVTTTTAQVQCNTDTLCTAELKLEGVSQGITGAGTSHSWDLSALTAGTLYNFTIDATDVNTNQDALQYQGDFTTDALTAPVFSLDLANPPGAETRVPGNCHAFNGSYFKLFSDPGAPITIGVPDSGIIDSPFDDSSGATFYLSYPPWTQGKSVAIGNKLWLNKRDGTTKIVTMTQNIVLPNHWDADPATYTEGGNYVPDLGLYAEPDIVQLIKAPTDLTQTDWRIDDSTVVFQPTGSPIEGQGYTNMRTTVGLGRAIQLVSGTQAGDIISTMILFRVNAFGGAAPVRFLMLMPGGHTHNVRFYPDGTITEDLAGSQTPATAFKRVRFLPGGWIYLHIHTTNISGGNFSLYLYPAYNTTGAEGDMDYAVVNVAVADFAYQPIPYQATRPGNTLNTLSADYATDWAGNGLEDAYSILLIARCPAEVNGATRLLAWNPTSQNAIFRENVGISRHRHKTPSVDIALDTQAGNAVLGEQHFLSEGRSGGQITLQGSRPGDPTATQSAATWNGQMEPSPTGIYLNTLLGNGPVIIRGMAWYPSDNVIDYEAFAGPGNYS